MATYDHNGAISGAIRTAHRKRMNEAGNHGARKPGSGKERRARQRKEYVVLSEILPDEVNSYSLGFEDRVVASVNGTPIRKLSDLPQALTSRSTGFLVIEFMGMERPLVLDVEQAEVAQQRTLEKYNVPSATNLEEQI